MKMLNDMELDQITGGYVDVKGKPSDAEIEAVDKMVSGICDAVCEGFRFLYYIYTR